jgi:glycosyltransferase involved in cell wall biosynthesis
MKILLINKFFYNRGGCEKVFFDTSSILERYGHKVMVFSMSAPENFNSEYSKYFVSNVEFEGSKSLKDKVRSSLRLIYSIEARKRLGELIKFERPDIVHLHNIYHHLSPSIIPELKKFKLPVVMTLHDYKLVCPIYTMLHLGKPCEQCKNKSFYRCFLGKCCKNSYMKSFLAASESYLYGAINNVYSWIDSFISPSIFLKDKFADMGFKRPINVLNNFIDTDKYEPEYKSHDNSVIYYGRLSAEKGLMTLIDAVRGLKINLKIFGTGPLQPQIEKRLSDEKINNIKLFGFKEHEELIPEIKKSLFTIIPSEWYENNPLSVIESFALGKPVLGSRIGGIPELVKDHYSGLTFEPGNMEDLKDKLSYLSCNKSKAETMGANAREFAIKNLNPEKYYYSLQKIYKKALEL